MAPASETEQAAYQNYLYVRDEVARMKRSSAATGADAPSEYWREELSAIDYLSDASPLIIRKLRHHAVHITGLRPYDYRRFGDRQPHFERRLEALVRLAGGRDLLVPEADALGGFGYSIDGRLYNVDTIKFFEVLVGMHRAGVLDAFRDEGTVPSRSGRLEGTAASRSGRPQGTAPSRSGRLEGTAASRSGRPQGTAPGGSGRPQGTAPGRSGRPQGTAPGRSGRPQGTAPSRSGRQGPRRMVWEIGGGWGGFAYQFKTLVSNTTYVIVDFAELFLFSATYLSTLFPQASIAFWREEWPPFEQWQEADFIFVPHDRVDVLRAWQPDLCVNLVSFHEMTARQVNAYAALAADAGCPTLYSLNRDRSVYNQEIDSVSHELSRHYDLREVRLLGSDYTKATKKDSAIGVEEGRIEYEAAGRYRHLVGTLRVSNARRKGAASDAAGAEARHEGPPYEQTGRDDHIEGAFTARQPHPPLVGIGVTLHNRAVYLCEALDSLLAQSYPHFRLVLVDDGSTDATETMAKAYERRDPRVRYVRFDERRGMIAAWRAAFELATADGVDYFAWASDHDRWDPWWLETLVGELERHPEAVLAYPLTERMDASGMPLPKVARRFETAGIADLATRWRQFSRSDAVAAGDMVYGLMRPDAARRAGIFRDVLCPDRLLLAELTIQGQIRQVPEVLWFRRQFSTGSVARQRSSLFGPGVTPPPRMTPPWYMHARSLWAIYGMPQGIPGASKSHVARLVATYTASYAFRHYAKTPTQRDLVWLLHRPRWAYKRAKHGVLVGVYGTLVFARRIGLTPAIERMCGRLTGRPRPWRRAANEGRHTEAQGHGETLV